jgi:hypothetical protein
MNVSEILTAKMQAREQIDAVRAKWIKHMMGEQNEQQFPAPVNMGLDSEKRADDLPEYNGDANGSAVQ